MLFLRPLSNGELVCFLPDKWIPFLLAKYSLPLVRTADKKGIYTELDHNEWLLSRFFGRVTTENQARVREIRSNGNLTLSEQCVYSWREDKTDRAGKEREDSTETSGI